MSGIDFSREVPDSEVLDLIDRHLTLGGAGALPILTLEEKKRLRQDLFHSIRRMDVLQDLLEDPEVTEIMVNGPDNIFIEKAGKLSRYPGSFSSAQKLDDVIQRIVGASNRVVNTSSPIVDCRLENGDRVNVVLSPIAVNGPILTIRRFPQNPITMGDLLRFGSIPEEIAQFLDKCVRAGLNIFISGGTGSGKTTFLNVLSDCIDPGERVITIEDNAELQIRHVPNLVQMEARNANVEGCRPISIRDLIKASLRMRPDRIVVGEVRGPEAIDMIQAMNTGHDGSMSTGHANSAYDMLSRLETMILMGMDLPVSAIRGQLASGIDLIVHLGRLRDRSRKLLEVAEILGLEEGQIKLSTLYRFRETGEENGKIIGVWDKEEEIRQRFKFDLAGIDL
ncbi:MAG: CpaF family protein [Lachnospiraceae bacterium]|nr:CpaF family protein [Lachnospiraceae bacterium]